MNSTAVIITTLICFTLIAICLLNHGGKHEKD